MSASNRHRPWIRLILVALALAVFLLAYHWGSQYQRPPLESGLPLPET